MYAVAVHGVHDSSWQTVLNHGSGTSADGISITRSSRLDFGGLWSAPPFASAFNNPAASGLRRARRSLRCSERYGLGTGLGVPSACALVVERDALTRAGREHSRVRFIYVR